MLQSQNGSYYTGVTEDLKKRYIRHKQRKGGYYTKYKRPNKIVYKEPFDNLLQAEAREQQIKGWSRSKKIALIKGNIRKLVALSKSRD